MTIAHREQQIQRFKASSFQPELDEALDQALRSAVIEAVKITLEAALPAEVKAELARMEGERPRRSGYFQRGLDTQYGHLSNLMNMLKQEWSGRFSDRETMPTKLMHFRFELADHFGNDTGLVGMVGAIFSA